MFFFSSTHERGNENPGFRLYFCKITIWHMSRYQEVFENMTCILMHSLTQIIRHFDDENSEQLIMDIKVICLDI